MTRGVPVNAVVRARILKLHREGVSRNDIARLAGVSTGVVSRIVKSDGGTFKRAAATREATQARSADLAEMRQQLAIEMHAIAMQEAKRARAPYIVHSFGGAENIYREHELMLPPAAEVQKMQNSVALGFDKLSRIVEKSDTGLEQAVGVLDTLAEGFRAAADKYRGGALAPAPGRAACRSGSRRCPRPSTLSASPRRRASSPSPPDRGSCRGT